MAREHQCIQTAGEIAANDAAAPPAKAAQQRPYHVEVVADAAALARLKPEWDALLAQSAIDHPFLSHEWILSWWESFGAGKSLHLLLVRAGGRLAGIAPLMRCEKRMYGIRAACLEALYNPHTPRFDFIVAAREAQDVYRCIWNHLREQGGWDLLELSQLPADSATQAALARLAREDRCATGVWRGEQSPYIRPGGNFETYFSELSYNHRSKVRRKLNRLRERGEVRLEVVTAAGQAGRALDDGFRIEAAGWKSQTGTAISSTPEVAAFYRALAPRAAAMGALRLIFLTLNGVRIAFAYGICHRNRLYVMKTGYDPEYSYYSPYNLLCYLVFEDGFAHGLEEYDFLGNNEPWKLAWTKAVRRHDWLYIFARTPSARLLHLIKFRWIPFLRDALAAGRRRLGRPAAHDGAVPTPAPD